MVFEHPATFGTLALDPEVKDDIMEDCRKFSQRENYYKKLGRAWKPGYLLYGPPGTRKSSMIAAISNFLEYDIYDLELAEVKTNTELRKLLIGTTNESIIVIEDIDCSLDLSDRKKKAKKRSKEEQNPKKDERDSDESKVTLSGVLNFTDDHPLFEKVEVLMKKAEITPTDVTEELMRVCDNPTAALEKSAVKNEIAPENESVEDNLVADASSPVAVIGEDSSLN
ncbi:hypothetical protein SUGI_0688080 [Cryptomeria japonica]|nr:hypothetical protein SUGI_0688080 [Cryptomeria japonica]